MALAGNKTLSLLRICWLMLLVFSCLIALASPSICRAENQPIYWKPQIEIPIVGNRYLDFQAEKGIEVNGRLLGNYISTIYVYSTGVVGILAVVVLMVAGFIRLTAGGDAGRVKQANEYVSGAITGILLLFFSYTILRLVNPDLVMLKNLDIAEIRVTGTANSGAQTNIRNSIANSLDTKDTASIALTPEVAQYLHLSKDSDCAGYNAAVSMQELAEGGQSTACDQNCNCNQKVTVDSRLLKAVINQGPITRETTITSITSGRHEINSKHYLGEAIDIVPEVGGSENQGLVWSNEVTRLQNTGLNAFCDKGGKAVACDQADHIHVSTK